MSTAILGGSSLAALQAISCSNGNNKTNTPASNNAIAASTRSAATAAGGASPQTSSASAATPSPVRGGKVKIANILPEVPDYNMAVNASAQWICVLGANYSTVLKFDPHDASGTKLVGDLATSWEVSSPTQMTFKFPTNVQFHDGTPFTSNDVKATFQYYIDAKVPTKFQTLSVISSMQTPDPQTLTVTLSKPYSSFLNWLGLGPLVIVPAAVVQTDIHKLDKQEIGTGPYKLQSHTPGVSMVQVRDPNYFKAGLPYLDEIDFLFLPDETSMIAALQSGQIDWVVTQGGKTTAESAKAGNIVVQRAPSLLGSEFGGNAARPPFNDDRVRLALSLAVDRQKALAVVNEGDGDVGTPIYSIPGLGLSKDDIAKLPGYNPATKDSDIASAKQLLSAAGYANGFPLTMISRAGFANYQSIATFAAEELKKLNITVTIKSLDSTAYNATQVSHDWDFRGEPGAGFIMDPAGSINYWGQQASYWPTQDPQVISLYDQMEAATDAGQRSQLVAQLQRQLVQDANYVVLFWGYTYYMMNTKIQNFTLIPGVHNEFKYEDVWLKQS